MYIPRSITNDMYAQIFISIIILIISEGKKHSDHFISGTNMFRREVTISVLRKITLGLVLFVLASFLIFTTSVINITHIEPEAVCEIPELDIWDESLKKFIYPKPGNFECPKAYNILTVNSSGYIDFNQSALEFYSLRKELLECSYHTVERMLGDRKVKLGQKVKFQPPTFVTGNVFRASCWNRKQLVYDFVHFNPVWIDIESRETEIMDEDDDHLSVFLIGIDSVSRSQAMRALPKSYTYLTESIGVYDFHGYMKLGLNTWPNLIPLLTGRRHQDFPAINMRLKYCDSMPLLWKEKSLKNYATYYGEDRSDISTFYEPGFYDVPTDFYYRPYNMAMNLFIPYIMKPVTVNNNWVPFYHPCYGNIDNFTLHVEHFKGYLNRYQNKRKFAVFWSNAAHDGYDSLQHMDDTLLALLQWMKLNGHLKRTVMVLLSDHGYHLDGLSSTQIGRLESHFPFLNVYIPDIMKKKQPWVTNSLEINTKRLVTHYDVHKTIIDLTNGDFQNAFIPFDSKLVARNLFSHIPADRTCKDAGIPPEVCPCQMENNVSSNGSLVFFLAQFAVSHINTLIFNNSDSCRRLTLSNVTEAKVQHACTIQTKGKINQIFEYLAWVIFGVENNDCGESGRYKIVFSVVPGKGSFDALVDYNELETDEKALVIGDIARLNRYGNQSHCVKESRLLCPFCYCNDLVW